jgi:hypothetical protein
MPMMPHPQAQEAIAVREWGSAVALFGESPSWRGSAMVVSDNAGERSPTEPHPKLLELTERLSGRWRVTGPGIDGKAEYKSLRGGFLLVMNVDFVINGTEMRVIQHVAYDQDGDTLEAHYLDTMGDESTYTWVLDGQKLRVSLGNKESDTFFEASLNEGDTEYVGTWHYPDNVDGGATDERIAYSRIGEQG